MIEVSTHGRIMIADIEIPPYDLVDFEDASIYMFVDDEAYRLVSAERKHYDEAAAQAASKTPLFTPERLGPPSARNVLYHLLEHYWTQGLDLTVLDVGAQYGTTAIALAGYIRAAGRRDRVVCFEPGLSAELLERNIVINGFRDCISCHKVAVSDVVRDVEFHQDYQHTEDGRIGPPAGSEPSDPAQRVVKARPLDSFLFEVYRHAIVKVDTQGHEPHVLAGMTELRKRAICSILFEFTPAEVHRVISPEQLLYGLLDDGLLLGQLVHCDEVVRIERDDVPVFVHYVNQSRRHWTDVLYIPHRLPAAEEFAGMVAAPSARQQQRLKSTILVESVEPALVSACFSEQLWDRTITLIERLFKEERGSIDSPMLNYQLAYALQRTGASAEATSFYGKALALGHDAFWTLYHRSLCYFDLGEYAAARTDILKAIEIDPSRADCKTVLDWIENKVESADPSHTTK